MQQRESRARANDSTVQLERSTAEKSLKQYRVLNVSRGGLCFESENDEFVLNEIIKFDLKVNSHSVHKANGRVCYCNSDDKNSSVYGLSFVDKFLDMELL